MCTVCVKIQLFSGNNVEGDSLYDIASKHQPCNITVIPVIIVVRLHDTCNVGENVYFDNKANDRLRRHRKLWLPL